jgi:Na+-transporting NADH:ubiquinone oxidoreductase subunit NqrC
MSRRIFEPPVPATSLHHAFINIAKDGTFTEKAYALMLKVTERDVRHIVEEINDNKLTDLDTQDYLFKKINGVYINVLGTEYEQRTIHKLKTDLHVAVIKCRNALKKRNTGQIELDVIDELVGVLYE